MPDNRELVLVLDFGGQYKELIARTVRGLSVYSEIRPGTMTADEVRRLSPIGIILTGGPNSVYLPGSPMCAPEIFNLGIPVLGICYGMHMICHALGGEVTAGGAGEYGRVTVTPANPPSTLVSAAQGKPFAALMSHRDVVSRLPDGFRQTASTAGCVAACENAGKKLFCVQFHPETKHTDGGREFFRRFLYDICGASGNYKLDDYIDTQANLVRQKVGENKVLLALSGGVDSSVCASLLSKALPNRLVCLFVDHGFMRLNEGDEIERVFSARKLRFIRVNAKERFLARLCGVADPEAKRKLIGEEFARVFEEEAAKLGDIRFLAQGTIYPDIVESGGSYGATIKSHHNVGGLPSNLKFTGVVEPLSGLFKDEVRILGRKLGLPAFLVNRQPFPGPGLAIRIIGEVTEEKLNVLRAADAILREEIDRAKRKPDQYFAVLTDTRSVGVKGDERTYSPVIALRAVTTDDFMTCGYAPIPYKTLSLISSRITSEIPAVSRVVYDITSKPPATVEWE
jgi:GMP synthase (glutamine-hydrolysing)